jgi:hypothetical protein
MTCAVGRSSPRQFVWAAIVLYSLIGTSCTDSGLSDGGSPSDAASTEQGPPVTAGPQAEIDAPRVVHGTYIWQAMPVGAGGFVTGIVASAGPAAAIYARTDVGGAYRWEPAAEQWHQLLDATTLPDAQPGDVLSVDSIAVAPSLATRVYLALGNDGNPSPDSELSRNGRVLVSDDGGASWQTSEGRWFISGNQHFRVGSERLVVDPANPDHVLFGTSREGLFQSFDAGTTWQQIPLDIVPTGLSSDPGSDQAGVATVAFVGAVAFAAVANTGVFVSSDSGTTWRLIREFEVGQYGAGAVEVSGNLWMAINRTDGGAAQLTVFDLDTETWSELPTPSTSPFAAFAVDPTNPLRIALADEAVRDDHLWSSTDGGQTWTTHGIEIVSPQIPWLANTDLDGFMSTGRLMFDDTGTLWFAEGMAAWRTTDLTQSTVTFTSAARGIEETVTSAIIAPPGGAPIGAVADRQGFRFDDTSRYPTATLIDETFVGGTSIDYSAGTPEVVAWVGAEYHIYYSDERRARGALSTDGGVTWRQFGGTNPAMFGGEIAVSAVDPTVVVWLPTHYTDPWEYSRTPVGVYYSHDSGQSWTHIEAVAGIDSFHRFMWWFNRRALAADRVNGNFYLMSDEGRFFASTDNAATWQEAAAAPPCFEFNGCHVLGQLHAQPGSAERLWAGVGADGLYRSDDAGRTAWTKIAGVDEVKALGFGAPIGAGGPLAVFLYGRANGGTQTGLFRSDDDGVSWQLISSFPAGSYAEVNSISGDLDSPGRVYVAFGGTGFVQGDPIGAAG